MYYFLLALNAAIDNNPPPTGKLHLKSSHIIWLNNFLAMNEVPTTSQGLPSMVDAGKRLPSSLPYLRTRFFIA